MPRSSRHKSSHKSQRRSSPVDWSGSDEERELESRVSRDSESEKRKSSHSKEPKESNNGYGPSDHGKKRKERIASKDESGASDRWDNGLGKDGDDDAMVEKRSKGDVYNTVDVEKDREREKYLKEESKSRSSRRHDERSEEKRRYKEERDREKEREREKDKAREKEKEKEREKEKESDRDREREKDRDRDRERSSRRDKYEEDKREKDRHEGDRREKETYEEDKREKERHLEDKREKHRYEEVKREKERYDDDKREKLRHDDTVAGKKRESETSRFEEGNSVNKDVDIITETDPVDREQREKHSKRRRDEISPEVKDRDREREKDREREREKDKERHKDDHSKSQSSKEHKSEPDKYKDKHRDRDERREREYYEYKSSRDGNRSSESRYKRSKGSESDPYDTRDEYVTKYKDGHGSKRGYEATEDRHERDVEKEDVERSRGEYRYVEKEKEKEKEKFDTSPGKNRLKNSPGSVAYHDREQSRHRSKPIESPKKESIQEDRPRARTSSSTGERTPSRLRDEKLSRPRDDALSLELSSEIASSTPRSDTHASPKFAPERSPSNTSLKYSSGRGGSGSSKYRDRDRDRERESDVPTPDKLNTLKREPTPVGTFNRSNSSSSYPPLPYEDGDNRRENGPDRRFHKRGGHAHGNNNWNGTPNWASQVNNGFMPMPPGPPPPSGFHHFGGPPPPLFGIRPPPMKLGPSGVVPFPLHDPMDRFSGHMRGPYGWHNSGGNNPLVEDSFPPNLWGPAGNGVFGTEPFWDQNRPLPWKAQGEMLNKELINVPPKEMGAMAPGTIKIEEQIINENLAGEIVDIKDESIKGGSSVEASIKDQILQKVAPEVDNRQEANVKVGNFWESYIPRIAISRNLVDLEILEKCKVEVGELEKLAGASDMSQAGVMDGKEKRHGMSIVVLKSLFPTSKNENFEKAMSLYSKLSKRQNTEENNGLLGAPDLKESEIHGHSEDISMQVEVSVTNISPMGVTADLGNNMEVDKKVSSNLVSDSDSVIFKAESEQVMKESSEDGLSRIPVSTENTH